MLSYNAYIKIDPNSPEPFYKQLATQLINKIKQGYLKDGLKLPGSRSMAGQLGVHRNTVVLAYELLEAKGWVYAGQGRGTFISTSNLFKGKVLSPDNFPRQAGFDFKRWPLLDSPFEKVRADLRMDDGLPDNRIVHLDIMARLFQVNMRRKSTVSKLAFDNYSAHQYFKENLTDYLNISRGLRANTDQLLITRTQELALHLVAETLLTTGDRVVVGDLSYFAVNMIFQKAGAYMQTIPVDEQGIDVDALEVICQQYAIRILYIGSHYYYPTTVTLSEERRSKLLQLATRYGFIILEDDYDFEFNYEENYQLPLAARDNTGMVIYIGTFGRSMPSTFRSGFIVAPANLVREMEKFYQIMDRYGDRLGELALGEFIEDRETQRHFNQVLPVYKERRDTLSILLAKELGDRLDFEIPSGGLAIWTNWNKDINLLKLSKLCNKEGLYIPPYLLYQNEKNSGFRIGFGSMNSDELMDMVTILKRASD